MADNPLDLARLTPEQLHALGEGIGHGLAKALIQPYVCRLDGRWVANLLGSISGGVEGKNVLPVMLNKFVVQIRAALAQGER